MIAKVPRARMAAALALCALAAPAAQAGPISEMLTRHRQQRQMKLPPMDKPFSTRPVRDLNTPSLAERFKKRFALRRGAPSSGGIVPMNQDSGVVKTSR